MSRAVLVSAVLAACHATARSPQMPEAACAAALPELAAQHTRNVTRIYLATFAFASGVVTIGAPKPLTEKPGYVNQPAS